MRDCRGNEENWAGAVRTGDFLNWNGKPDLERWVGNWFEGGKSLICKRVRGGSFYLIGIKRNRFLIFEN